MLVLLAFLLLHLPVRQVPAVQVPDAGAQVRREAEPAEIGDLAPSGDAVDAGPEVGQVAVDTGEAQDVGGGLDGAAGTEEEGHPDDVEGELDGVEGHGVAGGSDGVRGGEW